MSPLPVALPLLVGVQEQLVKAVPVARPYTALVLHVPVVPAAVSVWLELAQLGAAAPLWLLLPPVLLLGVQLLVPLRLLLAPLAVSSALEEAGLERPLHGPLPKPWRAKELLERVVARLRVLLPVQRLARRVREPVPDVAQAVALGPPAAPLVALLILPMFAPVGVGLLLLLLLPLPAVRVGLLTVWTVPIRGDPSSPLCCHYYHLSRNRRSGARSGTSMTTSRRRRWPCRYGCLNRRRHC